MTLHWTHPVLLCLLLPSCAGLKQGRNESGEGANPYEMADNGGFSPGGFYGDPAAAGLGSGGGGYPAEGQTFGRHDSGYPTVSHPTSTPSEQAQIVPFSESGYSQSTATGPAASPPKPAATAAPVRKPSSSPAVASTGKKASTSPSAGAARAPSRTTAGTKGGSVVKAVYHPSGSSGAGTKKKTTLHRSHTVKRGDTLSALASRYDVTVAAVKQRNQLPSDLIRVGQRLAID